MTKEARFRALYTGALTDVLDRRGHLRQTLPAALAPLAPGTRLAGPAFTVEGRPHPEHDYDESIRKILAMLGDVLPGHVAVYQTNDSQSAHFGELSATSLQARGCRGVVIDGGCRDVDYLRRLSFPVFCRYTTPQDCVPRWELTATNVPVTIGEVRVEPGDWVVADHDGIVVVPAAVADDVLSEAEEKVSTESDIRAAVLEGMLPLDAYERYGTF